MAGPGEIGIKESRYVAETGVRVPPSQMEPGGDLVGEGGRALPRQGEAAVDMAVLKERQGRGVALAVRLRQSFRRPRGGRAGEARHDEMKNDNNDKCALASRQGHDKSPSVRDERRG